jgi:hypothetical protein
MNFIRKPNPYARQKRTIAPMIAIERYTIFRIPTSVTCFSIFIIPYVVIGRIDLCEYDFLYERISCRVSWYSDDTHLTMPSLTLNFDETLDSFRKQSIFIFSMDKPSLSA